METGVLVSTTSPFSRRRLSICTLNRASDTVQVLLSHMYQAPASAQMMSGPTAMATAADDKAAQDHFDEFYEEVCSLVLC